MLATSAARHDAGRSRRWGMDTRIQRPDRMLLQSIWGKGGRGEEEKGEKKKKKKEKKKQKAGMLFTC